MLISSPRPERRLTRSAFHRPPHSINDNGQFDAPLIERATLVAWVGRRERQSFGPSGRNREDSIGDGTYLSAARVLKEDRSLFGTTKVKLNVGGS